MKGEKFLLSQNIGFRTDLYLSTEDYSNIGKGSLQKNVTKNGKSPEFSTTNDLDFLKFGNLIPASDLIRKKLILGKF